MSLPLILLGLLDEPRSGYDLRGLFERSLSHFWWANLNQIYPALHKLEEDGLVRSAPRESARGPDRVEYRRTRAGTARLRAWLEGPPELGRTRLPYLAQTFFLADRREDPASFLRALRESLAAQLETIEALHSAWLEVQPDPASAAEADFFPYLTLLHGLYRRRALVGWAEEALEMLEQRGVCASLERPLVWERLPAKTTTRKETTDG